MHPINYYNVFYVFLCHYCHRYHHCVPAVFTERIQSVHSTEIRIYYHIRFTV